MAEKKQIVIMGDAPTAVPFVTLYEQAGLAVEVWDVKKDGLATAVADLNTPAHMLAPHTHSVAPLLDELDPAAFTTGIVNLITIQDGERYGHNTIVPSFLAHLAELGVNLNGRDCIVLGRGGLAVSILYALTQAGGHAHWLTTHLAPAYRLTQEWADLFPDNPPQAYLLGMIAGVVAQTTAPLIVNTTTVGSGDFVGQSLWPYNVHFPAGSFVYDVVYDPPQTKLMTQAEKAGCQVINGQELLGQQVAHVIEKI